VFHALNASPTTGSLARTQFLVTFSYDASQVLPVGDSYVPSSLSISHCSVRRSIDPGGQF
jgi:hypothetical protein